MAISKITLNGVVQIDLTSDTVTAQTLLDDYVAHGNDGETVTGELVMPTARTASDVTVSGATVTIPSGAYASQVQKSVATGTAGTPSATKGSVSNHSVSVTPSVTNSEGWISSGTKTGTAVTVTASELASGDKAITQNGSNIDVVGYSTVSVSVSSAPTYTATISGSGDSSSCYVSLNNTAYYTDGNTFTYEHGDTLICWCTYGNSNGVYVDGTKVTSGSTVYGYEYTLPSGGVTIALSKSIGTSSISITTNEPTISITQNGTYDVYDYSKATVNVGGDYTYIGSTEFTVSTTSTTSITVGTFQTGDTSIWTSAKMVFIKIRDKAGIRANHLYGGDYFIYNTSPRNGLTATSAYLFFGTMYSRNAYYLVPFAMYRENTYPQGYGVYPRSINSDGDIVFEARYNSNTFYTTQTIDGTFVVEVYTLKYPNDITPFDDDYS